jgi:chemotaxis protein CheX
MTVSVSYESELKQIFADVFESMLRAPVGLVSESAADPVEVEASVSYEGAWNGMLVLQCTVKQAIDWAVQLMGITPPSGFDSDVRDALGELANMVGGNLKAILPPKNKLSVPRVALSNGSILQEYSGYNLNTRLVFEGSISNFSVILLERKAA